MRKRLLSIIIVICIICGATYIKGSQENGTFNDIVTKYYHFMNENNNPSQEELLDWVAKLENSISNTENNERSVIQNQILGRLYCQAKDYNKAEESFRNILANEAGLAQSHPNVKLEAAYEAFKASLLGDKPTDDSLVYLDIFEECFDNAMDDAEVMASFSFERVQTNRYRAEAYKAEFLKLPNQNVDAKRTALEKSIEYQKAYINSLNTDNIIYIKQAERLDHMGWGIEGSLYALGESQSSLGSVYRTQNIDSQQICLNAIKTYETLLNKYPQQRYSDVAAAALLRQKAFELKDPKLFLEYSKTIPDKVKRGYEFIGQLNQAMMQIASYNQWPDGPKWNNSGLSEAKKVAIEMGDFVKEVTQKAFPDSYKTVNILKLALMNQTQYCIDIDDLIKAVDTFEEVTEYGIEGQAFLEQYRKLESSLRNYLVGIDIEEAVKPTEEILNTTINNSEKITSQKNTETCTDLENQCKSNITDQQNLSSKKQNLVYYAIGTIITLIGAWCILKVFNKKKQEIKS